MTTAFFERGKIENITRLGGNRKVERLFMKLHSTVNVLGISILLAAFANGQTKKLLTNDDVVEMVKAGFEESTVVKLIQSSDTSFDTSVSALIALKKAGVSEQVISAMLQKRSNSD